MQQLPFLIPTCISRYDLLSTMATELADALRDAGHPVNPDSVEPPYTALWLNFLTDVNDIPPEAASPDARIALIQFFVDHPLALWTQQLDSLARFPTFRLLLPCADSAHLLRLRWPTLRHIHCLHAIPPRALCSPDSISARHAARPPRADHPIDDVIILASIHPQSELDDMRARIPFKLQKGADDAVRLLLQHPHMTFEQAADLTLSTQGVLTGEWNILSSLWKYATAAVNRQRRVKLALALDGLPVVIHGSEAWTDICSSSKSLEYRGNLPYAEIPGALARSRVCLAYGPTQFTHSFSERLLLSLAGGCATVADDRILARAHFAREDQPELLTLVDAADPQHARYAVEAILKDPDRRASMARAARDEVERAHLWSHRIPIFHAAIRDAIA
ncbi:MAG: glycosyltransferase [Phycisphaerales bacterium]